MKSLKNQMDTIEMKVAAECKEAFAELQTSMNQMAAELPTGTPIIPFLTYRDYAARVRKLLVFNRDGSIAGVVPEQLSKCSGDARLGSGLHASTGDRERAEAVSQIADEQTFSVDLREDNGIEQVLFEQRSSDCWIVADGRVTGGSILQNKKN